MFLQWHFQIATYARSSLYHYRKHAIFEETFWRPHVTHHQITHDFPVDLWDKCEKTFCSSLLPFPVWKHFCHTFFTSLTSRWRVFGGPSLWKRQHGQALSGGYLIWEWVNKSILLFTPACAGGADGSCSSKHLVSPRLVKAHLHQYGNCTSSWPCPPLIAAHSLSYFPSLKLLLLLFTSFLQKWGCIPHSLSTTASPLALVDGRVLM